MLPPAAAGHSSGAHPCKTSMTDLFLAYTFRCQQLWHKPAALAGQLGTPGALGKLRRRIASSCGRGSQRASRAVRARSGISNRSRRGSGCPSRAPCARPRAGSAAGPAASSSCCTAAHFLHMPCIKRRVLRRQILLQGSFLLNDQRLATVQIDILTTKLARCV
jgi:hypothetical protein